ncbi:Pepco domain-containing protein [Streptomyces sp. NPDC055239]
MTTANDDATDRIEGQSLAFWVEATDEDDNLIGTDGGPGGDSKGLFNRDGDAVLRAVPLGPLRKNLADTVDALQQLFKEVAERDDTLAFAEAQLSFQVTASGSIQLIGTGQVQGTRGLTLTFKRPTT